MRLRILFLPVIGSVLMGCDENNLTPANNDLQIAATCLQQTPIISETDEQAYLQLGGAFDQLFHDEGAGEDPIKMTTKIDRYVKQQMCEQEIPGMVVGIVWHGNLVYIKGYGLARGWETASAADDVPVRGQRSRFRWASVSKTVTGVAATIAHRDGIFDIDAPLNANYNSMFNLPNAYYTNWSKDLADNENWQATPPSFIPMTPAESNILTTRLFLSNWSGAMHYGEGDPNGGGNPSNAQMQANTGFTWAINEWASEPLLFKPGTAWNYSSYGFNLAGTALDDALQTNAPLTPSYWEYVQSKIVNKAHPVAMKYFHPDDVYDSQYDGAPWYTKANRVHGYSKDDQGVISVNKTPHDVSWKLPSGGFISTGADMALYAKGLVNYRFLDSVNSKNLLWKPQQIVVTGSDPTPKEGYALGFQVFDRGGELMVAHNGGQEDTATRLLAFPEGKDKSVGKLAIIVMSNARYANRGKISNDIEVFLRNPYTTIGSKGFLFEGTDNPNDPSRIDVINRSRNADEDGPYVNDAVYATDDKSEDLNAYREPEFVIDRAHQFDSTFQWQDIPVDDSGQAIPDDETTDPTV